MFSIAPPRPVTEPLVEPTVTLLPVNRLSRIVTLESESVEIAPPAANIAPVLVDAERLLPTNRVLRMSAPPLRSRPAEQASESLGFGDDVTAVAVTWLPLTLLSRRSSVPPPF